MNNDQVFIFILIKIHEWNMIPSVCNIVYIIPYINHWTVYFINYFFIFDYFLSYRSIINIYDMFIILLYNWTVCCINYFYRWTVYFNNYFKSIILFLSYRSVINTWYDTICFLSHKWYIYFKLFLNFLSNSKR